MFGEASQGRPEAEGLSFQAGVRGLVQGLPGQFADDLEVQRRVYYNPHMVCVVTRLLLGVIDGVNDDRQCFQFPVREGPEDGGPCEVVLVKSACRVRP